MNYNNKNKNFIIIKYLFLIIILIINIQPNLSLPIIFNDITPDNCTATLISFELCNSSLLCQTRFYIDENGNDLSTFQFLYTSMVTQNNFQSIIEPLLCNFSINSDETFQILWIEMMSRFHYCHDLNEYFDNILGKCVCKIDKVCKYVHPKDLESHFTEYVLPLGGIIIIFAISGFILHAFKKLKQECLTVRQYLERLLGLNQQTQTINGNNQEIELPFQQHQHNYNNQNYNFPNNNNNNNLKFKS